MQDQVLLAAVLPDVAPHRQGDGSGTSAKPLVWLRSWRRVSRPARSSRRAGARQRCVELEVTVRDQDHGQGCGPDLADRPDGEGGLPGDRNAPSVLQLTDLDRARSRHPGGRRAGHREPCAGRPARTVSAANQSGRPAHGSAAPAGPRGARLGQPDASPASRLARAPGSAQAGGSWTFSVATAVTRGRASSVIASRIRNGPDQPRDRRRQSSVQPWALPSTRHRP